MESTKAEVEPLPFVPVICITLSLLRSEVYLGDYIEANDQDRETRLALYPILCRYSTISGIAKSLRRPPEARTASRVAALD